MIPGTTSRERNCLGPNPDFTIYYLCDLGNLLNLSEPQFIYLENGDNSSARINVSSYLSSSVS